jgi:hypothetical protein
LRPVPHVGAGLAVCEAVDVLGDGCGARVVVTGFGVLVVFPGCGAAVVLVTVEPVRTGSGSRDACVVAFGLAVALGKAGFDGVTAGALVGATPCGVGLSLTVTWRLERSLPPNVVGMTLSGRAWKPMNARRPVATVASMTMTMLDSSDPRWVLGRVTAVTSPVS